MVDTINVFTRTLAACMTRHWLHDLGLPWEFSAAPHESDRRELCGVTQTTQICLAEVRPQPLIVKWRAHD